MQQLVSDSQGLNPGKTLNYLSTLPTSPTPFRAPGRLSSKSEVSISQNGDILAKS